MSASAGQKERPAPAKSSASHRQFDPGRLCFPIGVYRRSSAAKHRFSFSRFLLELNTDAADRGYAK